ncbi:hypothetical protein EUGRSUZ_K00107 [Eucalyptus grandis]|uniref:Uncharacterized protein n=2 Tax=Eucalyptus grandis TaxID=71139 RepID=A0ACC3IPB1_EUCGR|nr:hypothetical protein EUGRSUZ_K00107 [Eucalyptus grandis]
MLPSSSIAALEPREERGKMTNLLDDEVEQDELFWNQEALKDEENDDNYEEEPEVADVFDSDFDEDEPDPDEEIADDGAERERPKKRLIYPGKTAKKKKKKQKVLTKLEETPKGEKPSQQSAHNESHDVSDEVEVERTVRKSTRTAVIVRQAERDAIRAASQATMKPIKRKKEGEEKRMTQEEMLLEAAQTEIMNLRNLERVLAREEEVKKRAIVHKAVYSGPQIRYISKDGLSFLEFTKEVSFQSEIPTASLPYPEKAVCAVTGLPAKYRDPKTGLPYATKEAFKIIRERYSAETSGVQNEMNMGVLYDSLSGKGFSARRKRSEPSNKGETSYLRYLARFRSVPCLEIDSSE